MSDFFTRCSGVIGEAKAINLVASGSAEIWKDGASIASIATPVPEAHTYAMLLAGLGLVGFMAQRKARTVI